MNPNPQTLVHESAPHEEESEPRLHTPEQRVLVVEDDLDLETILAHVLRTIDPNIQLHWCTSVSRAHQLLTRHRYDLVLADYTLHGSWSGMFLRHMCTKKWNSTPFVMMSAMSTRDYLSLSGDDPCPFLRKPFTVHECREFLKAMLPHGEPWTHDA